MGIHQPTALSDQEWTPQDGHQRIYLSSDGSGSPSTTSITATEIMERITQTTPAADSSDPLFTAPRELNEEEAAGFGYNDRVHIGALLGKYDHAAARSFLYSSAKQLSEYCQKQSRRAHGWLDNAQRRQSRQWQAIRRGKYDFETREEFRARIARAQQLASLSDDEASGSEADDEGVGGKRKKREKKDIKAKRTKTQSGETRMLDVDLSDSSVESESEGSDDSGSDVSDSPHDARISQVSFEKKTRDAEDEKESERMLRCALEMVHAGAGKAQQPPLVSSQHAIPKDEKIPGLESTKGVVQLHSHQRDGVGQMQYLEGLVQSWILADDPGLGKTLQAIALICLQKEQGPTLVVVPLGLMENWRRELNYAGSHLKVLEYYDAKVRNDLTVEQIREFDVVLTTYDVVAREWKPLREVKKDWPMIRKGQTKKMVEPAAKSRSRKGASNMPKILELKTFRVEVPLFAMHWQRVLLDEAHKIKNHETAVSSAVADLRACYYGCLTGTPLQNDYKDFFGLARFLHLEPWNNWALFHSCFLKPADEDSANPSAARHLDEDLRDAFGAIRHFITIRREKGQLFDGEPITGVPEPVEHTVQIELDEAEQQVEDGFRDLWDPAYKRMLKENKKRKQFPVPPKRPEFLKDVTQCQLRVMNPVLLEARYGDIGAQDAGDPTTKAAVTADEQTDSGRSHLLEQFSGAKPEELKTAKSNRAAFIHKVTAAKAEGSKFIDTACGLIKSILNKEEKRVAAIDNKLKRKRAASNGKILVFCPFLSSLDLLAIKLSRENIPFYELNGHTDLDERDDITRKVDERDPSGVRKDFTDPSVKPDRVRVVLASVKVAAEGLNLTAATYVLMLGLCWNPFIHFQALSRAHRMGQTRRVQVYYVYVVKSIHARVLRVQDLKRKKVSGVMDDRRLRKAAAKLLKWGLADFKAITEQKARAALTAIDANVYCAPGEEDDDDDDQSDRPKYSDDEELPAEDDGEGM